jgi:hypothetical protein
VLSAAVTSAAVAAKSTRAKSCTLLKPAQMAKVLDAEISKALGAGTGGYACSFDIGDGLGEPGGGLVIVTYYEGSLAKGIYQSAKKSGEKIPGTKALWDTNASTAMISKKGKVIAVNVSYTNDSPSTDDLRDEMAELAALGSKKL